MTGTATLPPATNMSPVTQGKDAATSGKNSARLATVTEKLGKHLRLGHKSNAKEIFDLCISLSRGIDYALVNNEIPDKVQELPSILKQVCQRKNDILLKAGVMVLMVSVKNACKTGWFSEIEAKELFSFASEIGNIFSSECDVQTGLRDGHSTISIIMERFYPLMKMGQILVALEVKPGYGAYVVDFHIPKKPAFPPKQKIHLLVMQIENIETSACIISPQQVSFLLNGKGVEGRGGGFVDYGPQIPTNVTETLKYGTNLLQAVGQFNGHYIIIVAFMGITSLPEAPILEDYVLSEAPMNDTENDIVEGPSRISLKCPISLKRIATPVKGCRCKHLQCFDFRNFVDINLRRPSWRCPNCNQNACYTELRIDQHMVKVLREVGKDVNDIIISADGSWKAVIENNANEDELNLPSRKLDLQVNTSHSIPCPMILDLTDDVDQMDTVDIREAEEMKPAQADLQNLVATKFITQPALENGNVANQNNTRRIEDGFWSDVYRSTLTVPSHVNHDADNAYAPEHNAMSYLMSPILTDAVSTAFNQVAEGHGNNHMQPSAQFSASSNMQLLQEQIFNSISPNEYGFGASILRNVTRNPVAVQALPAHTQTQTPRAPQQRVRPSHSVSSHAFQAALAGAAMPLIPHSAGQNLSSQAHTSIPNLSIQHAAGVRALSPSPGYRSLAEFQNPHLQQALNTRTPQLRVQSTSSIQPSFPQTQVRQDIQVGGGQSAGTVSSQRGRSSAPGPHTVHMTRQSPLVTYSTQTSVAASPYMVNSDVTREVTTEQRIAGGIPYPFSRTDCLDELVSERNWVPTGQMRGSLSGHSYSVAHSQFMNRTIQPAQVSRPTTNRTPPSVPTGK